MHAYIAGPLFNEGERWWNTEIDARVQRAGFTTYLPQRDGTPLKGPADVPKIFEEDREAISNADLVVANLNGLCVDSGTAWELGYAHGIGKPCVGLYTDWRLHYKYQIVNLMIQCGLQKLVTSLDMLEEYLKGTYGGSAQG